MTKMVFTNLPVMNLDKSTAFYAALGFTNEPKFTDDTAACTVSSDTIYVMLLTHAKWRTFTDRPIPDTGSSEVMLAISCDDRAEVDRLTDLAGTSGGTADVMATQDYGFMYGRSFLDPDAHIWETTWMDMSQLPEDAEQMA